MVSLKELARADAERVPPEWLRRLLEATFFDACPEHPGASRATRSAGCNLFCTRCTGRPLCSVCVSDHPGHQLIQVRKSSYHDVVKVAEVEHLLSLSLVQTYLINGEKVVFLNRRPISGQGKPGASRCEGCDRGLQDDACRFCSLRCKLEALEWDFDVSFAVSPESDSESGGDGSGSDGDSSRLTKIRKLGTVSRSSGSFAAGGNMTFSLVQIG
ncbi:protein RGF1 INDUCIBLE TRANSCRIPTION FACTOR 1-like [Phragmites australis]|uniref:protein RGF1 INDUCIBLE TRANSCRIPTION FACTOR 1-like n=1 Tax=Phragmites australis TaxID=29695 RepID=UPI002D78136D|nr:protein RGF1 INDUCIBLE TRANSCRIPTION FACTOR 1-like [Phragmites australis]